MAAAVEYFDGIDVEVGEWRQISDFVLVMMVDSAESFLLDLCAL
ncbi:hypothetical protein [Crenobacter oryzisoli]|nr:hypothetical protein [Crenobacter sp. SG2303]